MRIAAAPWVPDIADLDNSVTAVATNVFPEQGSFRPIPGPSIYSAALGSAPKGAWAVKKVDATWVFLAATASTLERLDGTSWTEVGSGYTVPTDEYMGGVQFGTNFYFTNSTDGLQVYDIEVGGAASAVGGAAPNAKHLDVSGGYIIAGNLDTDPGKVAWCDTEDGSTWSGGNSGSQSFKDGGAVSAIAGAAGLVIQETAVRAIIPDPGGDIFQFQKLEQAKGSIAPESVIRFGNTVAYLAEDGFWWNGQPIGHGRVNRWFFDRATSTRLFSVIGRADSLRPLFWWHYHTSDSDDYEEALIYNWRTDSWSYMSQSVTLAAATATGGTTLEALAVTYPDLDAGTIPYSFDSRVWSGGRPIYAVFDSNYKLAFMEGDALAATIETGDREIAEGMRVRVRQARPMVDTTAATITVGRKERQGNSRTWGSATSQQTHGACMLNTTGRLMRFRTSIPAASTWTHFQGVEVPDYAISSAGRR